MANLDQARNNYLIASKSKSTALKIIAYLEHHFEMTAGPAKDFTSIFFSHSIKFCHETLGEIQDVHLQHNE